MAEMTDQTKMRIFEKLDELQKEVHDVSLRLARVEEKQESHYTQNDEAHNNMTATFVDIKGSVEKLEKSDEEQQTLLDQRTGERNIFGGLWQLVLAAIGGGALIAIGGFLAKVIGIFE